MSRASLFERLARADSDDRPAHGIVVVTPNRRLARALSREFDAWQAARGRRSWETPRVLPYGTFVASLYDAALHDPVLAGVRAPLTATQEATLWESVVEASGLPLASPGAAAQLAAGAWSLAHQWQIADRVRHYAMSEDNRIFAGWAAEYARRLERFDATDQARLPDAVRALVVGDDLPVPSEVVLAGFPELTPQQDALFQALAGRGARVEAQREEPAQGDCRRMEAGDAHEELERMADWAAARLRANKDARIGVVVPDLNARRREIARALDAALAPDALLASPDRQRPYTVSLGAALADAPMVATAMRALRLAAGDVDFAEASALLRSPHVDFGPAPARACFDVEWRRRSGRTTSLSQLLAVTRTSRADEAPAPRAALEALQAWKTRVGTRPRRLSEWAALLMEALRAIGFPGAATPDSAEYQTLARWQELMAEFAALDRVQGALDLRAAVARLARLASATIFQPEGGDPPIHVVGLLEAEGLEFDHLWIAGLTSEAWPVAARAHPLLPLELQRAKRMPGALADVELRRAQAVLDRLSRSAPEVVASHAVREGDRNLAPSAMIAAWPEAEPATAAARAWQVIAPVPLETIIDARAAPLSDTRVVGGGASTLTDQSACPFRAFAAHRLGADEPEQPHDGLAASERGELVHRVLARFWESVPQRTRASVAALSVEQRASLLERAADNATGRIRERRPGALGDGLLAIEKRRLVTMAQDWLRFEIEQRGEFEVKAIEERRALAIGPLSLNGRLDRVDRLADGSTVIIDYKTGAKGGVRSWLGPRPDEPQLPLYLVASETGARAVAFARVRTGDKEFVALAEDESLLPKARVDWKLEHASWAALVQAWRDELTRLANDFAVGVAEVAPKRADTCRYCGVAVLCRLTERAGDVLAPEGEPGGADDE
ncbi:MAG: PD-(D/E)XK nuclease family protein [Burkholderiaceae bacterium]